jgi:hypothetical protein
VNVAASLVRSAFAGFGEKISSKSRKALTNVRQAQYAAKIHVVGLFSQSRAQAIAKKAHAQGTEAYLKSNGINVSAVPKYESPKFTQDTASIGATTKSSRTHRIKALEDCVEFIATEKDVMVKRDDVLAKKGAVHVIAKSIARVSEQIEASGGNLSAEDQAMLDSSLKDALTTFDSDAHQALREASLSKYEKALKDLHFAVTVTSMQMY